MLPFYQFVSFEIGPFTLYVWGVFVALGIFAATYLALGEARRKNIHQNVLLNLVILVVLSSMVFARLGYVVLFFEDFRAEPLSIFHIWTGGMVFYGGVAGGLIAGLVYAHQQKLPLRKVADI